MVKPIFLIFLLVFLVIISILYKYSYSYFRKENSDKMWKLWGLRTPYWEGVVYYQSSYQYINHVIIKNNDINWFLSFLNYTKEEEQHISLQSLCFSFLFLYCSLKVQLHPHHNCIFSYNVCSICHFSHYIVEHYSCMRIQIPIHA